MFNNFKAVLVAILILMYMPQAIAAKSRDVIAFQTNLSEMNRLKPLQNPRHELARDRLKSTLIDRENKVVGVVEDILIDINGAVQTIYAELDRLHLGTGVFLNYNDLGIKKSSNGYKIGMNSDEITTAYPELLANIETASGQIGISVLSVENLLGTDVIGSTGMRLGNIHEVLFDDTGSRVNGVYLHVDHKTIRDRGIAVPFDVLSFEQKPDQVKITIDQDYADAIVKQIKNN